MKKRLFSNRLIVEKQSITGHLHAGLFWVHLINPRTYAESIVLVTTADILMHDGGETRLGHNDQVPSARTLLLTCFFSQCRNK